MRILLTKDIKGLGKKGDVKDVSEGYARNALLPNGSAVIASANVVRQAEQARKGAENRVRKALRDEGRSARSVDGAMLAFREPTAETGRLYAALAPARIRARIEEEFGVRPDDVVSERPIKEPGSYSVVAVFGTAKARLTCIVTSDRPGSPQ